MKYEKHQDKIFTGEGFLEYVFEQTALKEALVGISSLRYMMRAMMAGIIVTFGYVGYILLDANFGTIAAGTNGTEITTMQPFGHFFAGWFFGFCLIFIYYAKAELLTSNMMALSVSNYYNKIDIIGMIKVMLFCYLGNLIGGILVGVLLANSTIITGSEEAVHYMNHVLEVKQGYTTSIMGVYDMFIRAVFCNFFINLSMLPIYAGNVKSDGGKALVMFGGVFFFMYLGLEHSVANSVFFALAGFTDLFNPDLGISFNFVQAASNVVVVLIGNFIGGGVMIGLYYAFLNDKQRVLDKFNSK